MASFAVCLQMSPMAAFLSHILHVGICGSQKQMIWIHATWDIASVQDKSSLWDWANVNLPRRSMRGLDVVMGNAEPPISIFMN